MAGREDQIGEHRRLRQESAKIRADAIRIRILTVHAFCSFAESYLRWGSPNGAEAALAVVRGRVSEIEFHLREPGHISMASADELSQQLIQLKARIEQIEKFDEGWGLRVSGDAARRSRWKNKCFGDTLAW